MGFLFLKALAAVFLVGRLSRSEKSYGGKWQFDGSRCGGNPLIRRIRSRCCAPAATGHAAAPPSAAINSRRPSKCSSTWSTP